MCQVLNDDREYSLHYEFSETIRQADEEAVEQITTFIAERQNPFDLSGNNNLLNTVSGKKIEKDKTLYLLNCVKMGREAYFNFKATRLGRKTRKLFDSVTKSFEKCKRSAPRKVDVKKETVTVLKCT